MEWIPFFKALHIIGFVSWFAGLFYLPRLFVYYSEAMEKEQPERDILCKQFGIMQERLYKIIMTPAMIFTFIAGFTMIGLHSHALAERAGWDYWWRNNIWMHWKLLFLILLVGYHHYCKRIIKRLKAGEKVMTSVQFRLFNEISTLFLVIIVLLAVFRGTLNFLYAFLGLIGLMVLLGMGVKGYKKIRDRADKSNT